ncbi:MAG: hypothetical protein OHK0017_12680 [Patescibacteria group bacterium]
MNRKVIISSTCIAVLVLGVSGAFYFSQKNDVKPTDKDNNLQSSTQTMVEKQSQTSYFVPYEISSSKCGFVKNGTTDLVGEEYKTCRVLAPNLFLVSKLSDDENYSTYEVLNGDLKSVYTTKQILTHVLNGYLVFKESSSDAKATVIDFDGKVILDSVPGEIVSKNNMDVSFPLAVERSFGKENYLTKDGKFLLKDDVLEANDFYGGVAVVEVKSSTVGIVRKYINSEGNFINSNEYYSIEPFSRKMSDGLAFVTVDREKTNRGFINSSGEKIVIVDKDSLATNFYNGNALVQKKNGAATSISVIDKQGNIAKTLDYKGIVDFESEFDNGLVFINNAEAGNDVLVNSKGDKILEIPKRNGDTRSSVKIVNQLIFVTISNKNLPQSTVVYSLDGRQLYSQSNSNNIEDAFLVGDTALMSTKFINQYKYFDSNGFNYFKERE